MHYLKVSLLIVAMVAGVLAVTIPGLFLYDAAMAHLERTRRLAEAPLAVPVAPQPPPPAPTGQEELRRQLGL